MATIKVKQIKSRIGANKEQKSTLLSLGLRKISQVIEVCLLYTSDAADD